ncbi:hypothetical protein SynWH8103_00281 [Synechococcus sp. WH 8103]|nr:hypothetical protein SynWH8103_00281 [Synechococcus sp. WH 8103]
MSSLDRKKPFRKETGTTAVQKKTARLGSFQARLERFELPTL